MQALTSSRFRTIFQKLHCFNEIQYRPCMSKFDQPLVEGSPKKPKRPANSFIIFLKNVEAKIYEENPSFTRPELVRIAGRMWRNSDEEVKSRYHKMFQEKRREYEEALIKFNSNLTKLQREEIANLEANSFDRKKKRQILKTLDDLGKPKRPAGSYALFLREQIANSTTSDEEHKDKIRRLAKEWRALSAEERQVYTTKAKEILNVYNHELKEWEKKVLKTFDMSDEDVEELREKSPVDGAPRHTPKRLSNYIYARVTEKKK